MDTDERNRARRFAEEESVGFNDEALASPTQLEVEVGHVMDEDEEAFISAVRTTCGVDAKRAADAYGLYGRLRAAWDAED